MRACDDRLGHRLHAPIGPDAHSAIEPGRIGLLDEPVAVEDVLDPAGDDQPAADYTTSLPEARPPSFLG